MALQMGFILFAADTAVPLMENTINYLTKIMPQWEIPSFSIESSCVCFSIFYFYSNGLM